MCNNKTEVIAVSQSICRFMPPKDHGGNIKTVRFVYESDFEKLPQPFIHPVYLLHIVSSGEGTMKLLDRQYKLEKGTVFFAFPGCPFEIEACDGFDYMYVSFMGTGATVLLNNLNVSVEAPVYYGFEHLLDMWKSSVRRINHTNSNILTESVLLYTLSFINGNDTESTFKDNSENTVSSIVDYVNSHYRDTDISLKKIAYVFSYTEKYLSSLFKKQMNVGFNSYLNNLRVQYAQELIEKNEKSVSKIATLCGYSDAMYFSKVFKKYTGKTPTEYIKSKEKDRNNGIWQFLV